MLPDAGTWEDEDAAYAGDAGDEGPPTNIVEPFEPRMRSEKRLFS